MLSLNSLVHFPNLLELYLCQNILKVVNIEIRH